MLKVGSTVDGWNIDAVIHQGSMAVTFAVSHNDRPTAYAMKLLFLQEPSFQERLRRAGKTLRTIRHPNLLPIVDVVEIEGKVAVVSEFVEGTNLTGWCEAADRTLTQHVQLFRKACLGLRAVHSHGLVHRNLKPAKILVSLTDHPYIHDFMLGKVLDGPAEKAVTQMGTTFGTPQYMAPEQFRGASNVDVRADVFSMGCILFEMVTGRRAFDGTGVVEIYQQVNTGDRPKVHDLRADCPPALEKLVREMLAPDPDDRVPTVRELIARLDGDADLRSLVNPSFSTATPVSALISERPVKTAVALDPPSGQQGPPKVLSVTPVEAPRATAPPAGQLPNELGGPVHRGPRGPQVASKPTDDTPRNPLGDLIRHRPIAELSQDSRPSLVTFTDGTSEDASVFPEGGLRIELPATPPATPPVAGVSPTVVAVALGLLFVAALGLGVLVATF